MIFLFHVALNAVRGARIRDRSASASIVLQDVCFSLYFKYMQELHTAPRRLYYVFAALCGCAPDS